MNAERLRGGVLYVDCFAGIAGDMLLGALFDLGVPQVLVRDELAKLPLRGWQLSVKQVRKGAMMATKVDVLVEHHADEHDHDHDHDHVHYRDIRAMLVQAGLQPGVLQRALLVFDRIAAIEARMHGVAIAEVMFHEVGAVDSIVDIVGAAAALHWLAPKKVISRPVVVGGGSVRTAHGMLPVPAPATLALLEGAPVESGGVSVEMTTPTGAGILATLEPSYGPLPPLVVLGTGYGAGTRDLADRPNLLRLILGQPEATAAPGAECAVIEANIDDMSPELYEPLLTALLQTGALDVWVTPVQMKKRRPGAVLKVLCEPALEAPLSMLMLRESTTLGVRSHRVSRTMLERTQEEVMTEYGPVLVKLGIHQGEVWNVAPEYESCRARAREQQVPLKQVYAAAIAAYAIK